MKVIFTNHVLFKIWLLKKHGFIIEKEFVEIAVLNPDRVEEGYEGKLIAQKRIDEKRVLRIVYKKIGNEILIITLYPARRERYEKNKI